MPTELPACGTLTNSLTEIFSVAEGFVVEIKQIRVVNKTGTGRTCRFVLTDPLGTSAEVWPYNTIVGPYRLTVDPHPLVLMARSSLSAIADASSALDYIISGVYLAKPARV